MSQDWHVINECAKSGDDKVPLGEWKTLDDFIVEEPAVISYQSFDDCFAQVDPSHPHDFY